MKIAYLTVCIAILFFLMNPWVITEGKDNIRHFQDAMVTRSISDGNAFLSGTGVNNSSPLYSIFSVPWTYHPRLWDFLVIFLFVGLLPLLLAFFTRNHWAPLFYYCMSPLTLQIFQHGWYTQGLLIIFVLLLLLVRRNSARFAIVLIGSLSHSTAVFLLPLLLFLILIKENRHLIIEKFKVFSSWFSKKALIFCPAFLDNPDIESFNSPVKEVYLNNKFLVRGSDDLINVFLIPLIFAYWSIKGLLNEKRYDLILLYPLIIIGFLVFNNSRVLTFIPFLSVIGFSFYWKTIPSHLKKWFFMGIFLYGEIKLVQWLYHITKVFCINIV